MTDVSTQTVKPLNRREAMIQGRRTYVGRPCKVHGAGARRYASSSACTACALDSANAARARERQLRTSELDIDDPN